MRLLFFCPFPLSEENLVVVVVWCIAVGPVYKNIGRAVDHGGLHVLEVTMLGTLYLVKIGTYALEH